MTTIETVPRRAKGIMRGCYPRSSLLNLPGRFTSPSCTSASAAASPARPMYDSYGDVGTARNAPTITSRTRCVSSAASRTAGGGYFGERLTAASPC